MRKLSTDLNLARDEHAIMACLFSFCEHMDIDYFRVALISPTTLQRPDVHFFNNCPTHWVNFYSEKMMFAIDPVVSKGMTQSTPILWAEVINECYEQSNLSGLEVMSQARDAGLYDGITIPWHGANGHVGLLSLITQTPRTELQWSNTNLVSSWLSNYVFEAITRVHWSPCVSGPLLSPRELEVCQWAAEGKQTSDVARILGVTPRTVSFHLDRVVEKLGASSKNQAISKVIKQGLIKLNIASARFKNIDAGHAISSS